jgi:NitT/TauT family transport system permease protein
MLKLLSGVTAVLAWALISHLMPRGLFPGPLETTAILWSNVVEGEVGFHLSITLLRVVGGFGLAMLIGIPAGVIMGLSRRAERVLDVWVMVGLTIPSLCYTIICFIWFGLNELATILAIAVTTAPSITINLWEGVKDIDGKLVDMARVFEASRWRIFARVVLPQVLPYVMAASRFGLGIIWKITVLVELLGRPSGVGFRLFYWYQLANMGQVLAWTLLFTLVMLFIELVIFKGMERRLFAWRPAVRVA